MHINKSNKYFKKWENNINSILGFRHSERKPSKDREELDNCHAIREIEESSVALHIQKISTLGIIMKVEHKRIILSFLRFSAYYKVSERRY